MLRNSRDDDQIFVVFMGSRNGSNNAGEEGGNVFLGVLAVAIVVMVFVGLLNDSERRRLRQWSVQPAPQQIQPLPRTSYPVY